MPKPTQLMIIVIGISLLVLSTGLGSGQNVGPTLDDRITETNLIKALKILKPQDPQEGVIKTIRRLGVDFETTKVIESELRKAGATPELVMAVKESYRQPAGPPPLPTPSPTLTVVRNEMGMELVWIPAGSFMMGSENGSADEQPRHQVTFNDGFYMGRYEVTIADWRKVMKEDLPEHMITAGKRFMNSERQPVVRVSREDAKKFVEKLKALGDGYEYRLPTEAEWEYACRAGTQGDLIANPRAIARYSANSRGQTQPVGTRPANGWGLYDMQGNVYEWCEDPYHENYLGAPIDGSVWPGGGNEEYGVMRGGSWRYPADDLRPAHRRGDRKPDYRSENIGFRVVAVARSTNSARNPPLTRASLAK